ncbi:MAG: RNA polymerase sigma factor [Marinilabiliales bacterium]|nr:RNA polymerase sigma factor [Marinilabiliales bacterium]
MPVDQTLIPLLRSGDEKAFSLLVQSYRKQVLNLCFRFLLNQGDAEDVSQEVFVAVFRTVKDFREESSVSTWIYRITVSKCLDELKRRSRKKRISNMGRTLGLESVVHWIAGSDRPDRQLEEHEAYTGLQDALERLHDSQRIALTLSKLEGYDHAKVAEIMQISPMAVDSLVYRARQNLKKMLDTNASDRK